MKWIISLGCALLFLTGCTYKQTPLSFTPYLPEQGQIVQGKTLQKVYLKSVMDMRTQNGIVAIATNKNGEKLGVATSATSIDLWLYEAVKKALEARGIVVVDHLVRDVPVAKIAIMELFATYNGELLEGKNMKAVMDVQVSVIDGMRTVTKNVSQRQSQWHGPIYASSEFEPFLQALMEDIAVRVAENIIVN